MHAPTSSGGTSYLFTPPATWTPGFLYAAAPAVGSDGSLQAVITPTYPEATIFGGTGLYGTYTNSTYLGGTKMVNAGTITNIEIVNTSTATCTTPPIFNVQDVTTTTNGTNPITASATGSVSGGTGAGTVDGNPGLTYNAGDNVRVLVWTTGSGCGSSEFTVSAQYQIQ
jgi:hypothetical protein